ncbi:MAG: beta-lactamase family protein [Pirellulales bacterium]|nr:beta-lactamase family protein [Pirellulales bacterium]
MRNSIAALCVLFLVMSGYAQENDKQPPIRAVGVTGLCLGQDGESIKMLADQLFGELDRPDVPGASVAVIRQGETLFARGYGLADLAQKMPADQHTNYRLASVSKQFTAMAIMMLKERGLLQYDDSIKRFFPDFPDAGQQITIRHLLGHTSGLVDYEAIIPKGQKDQLKDRDVLKLLQTQHGTYFTPGTQFRYSNSGYALLALIVEVVSGTDFATFLKENIFQPLGMSGTVAFEQGISSVSHRAYGYKKGDLGFVPSDQSVTSAVLGDGGIYTSVVDYLKWESALRRAQLISQESLEESLTPGRLPDGTSTGYGFGWRIKHRGDVRIIYHDGDTCGFSTAVRRIPERGLAIIVFINRAEEEAPPIADALLDWILEN